MTRIVQACTQFVEAINVASKRPLGFLIISISVIAIVLAVAVACKLVNG